MSKRNTGYETLQHNIIADGVQPSPGWLHRAIDVERQGSTVTGERHVVLPVPLFLVTILHRVSLLAV